MQHKSNVYTTEKDASGRVAYALSDLPNTFSCLTVYIYIHILYVDISFFSRVYVSYEISDDQ